METKTPALDLTKALRGDVLETREGDRARYIRGPGLLLGSHELEWTGNDVRTRYIVNRDGSVCDNREPRHNDIVRNLSQEARERGATFSRPVTEDDGDVGP